MRVCACVCVCVSLSAAPLLPPTGVQVDRAAPGSILQPRRHSHGPLGPQRGRARVQLGEPKPEFTEAVCVLKKKKEKN